VIALPPCTHSRLHGQATSPVMTFREIYDEHFRFVWRSLRRLGVSESEAPDAVQDVFLVVHKKVGEFEGRSKMTTWLFGICMRVAAARRRAPHARREVSDDGSQLEASDDQADPCVRAERRQGLELLEDVLSRIPLEQRAVFVMFELDGMSGDDIAELLEIPTGTVHSRLRLAREAFRLHVNRSQAHERFPRATREV